MAIVYQHRRKDANIIFYVGIGKNLKRAYSKKSRSKYWKDITKNHEYLVEILFDDISWEYACEIEIKLIQQYGRRDLGTGELVNLTSGGDGVPNLSEESRKKMAVNSGKFGDQNYFYGKSHIGDLKRFGIQNKGKTTWMKGKKHEGDLSRFGIQNLGKISHNSNSICINKNGKNKYIKKQDLENYIQDGWSLGGKSKLKINKIDYESNTTFNRNGT